MDSTGVYGVQGSKHVTPIEWAENVIINGVSAKKIVPIDIAGNISGSTTERYDIQGDIIYFGTATMGASESASVWLIYKYDVTDLAASYGKLALNVKWSDRATETYT